MLQHQFFPNYFQQNQKQQTGFVVVNTEDEALRYPIAPGNSITFKVESQPIMIEKTMGFSQLDSPQVKRYRIVEEEIPVVENKEENALEKRIANLEAEVEKMRSLLPKRPVKKKEDEDE